MDYPIVTKTIAKEDTWSDWLHIKGYFNWSIWGTWAGTVTLQRTFDGAATKLNVDTLTANSEEVGQEPEGAFYRFGVKTGDLTSGTLKGRLGADPAIVPRKLTM